MLEIISVRRMFVLGVGGGVPSCPKLTKLNVAKNTGKIGKIAHFSF